MSLRARLVGILGALVIVAGGIVAVPSSPATALSGADFNPGLIISDEVFFNANTMTRDQIQAFLDAKGGTCQSGYTCLADYTQTTFTRAADSTCASYTGAANETAASIIFKVAKACGINPQVLLVTLQKEMSLITRTSPTSWSYKIAMGYGCPDTAPCDERFYGFYNQVYLAGRQLVRYGEFPDYYNWFPIGVATNVRYHPKEACGTKRVTIQSRATAALYYYTPYTPNAAALANLTSTGDACSSYGNRNFWRFFNAWFGSPVLPQTHINYVVAVYDDVLGRPASAREYPGWVRAILTGMPRQQVANGFVNSTEYRLRKIDEAYRTVLDREPDAGGRASWLEGIRRGQLTPDDVFEIFLSTKEFYLKAGGTDTAFVDALYQRVIGRPASVNEQAHWARYVVEKSRKWVVNAIYNSVETSRNRANETFIDYLGREATPEERISWGSFIRSRGPLAFRAAILATDEYWEYAQTRTAEDATTSSAPGPAPTRSPAPTPSPSPTPAPTASPSPVPSESVSPAPTAGTTA
ncbi:DUF4214 domain-containing protein [Microcella frigidaquae]|uniref:DUF4214 domain-containing protein n=1 Tax=Microcella frigidaquae TaxID=424758 RepID=UPI00129D46B1|nr:DUF4214 domain-containing protein [Microcella frigidaquae]